MNKCRDVKTQDVYRDVKTQNECEQGWEANIGTKIKQTTSI